MEIIPAIDIMRGKVVRASGADRALYPQLQSRITNSCIPNQVISDLLDWHPFTKMYIADLDAIEKDVNNHKMYRDLMNAFPELDLWIDAGIKSQTCWQKFNSYSTISPVIGSETLLDSEYLLSENVITRGVLSLDFRKDEFLGQAELLEQVERWTERVIVMELDSVGDRNGPNLERLLKIKQRTRHSQLIAAGGVRDKQDLMRLAEQGIKQALVASALHDGTLTRSDLSE